MAGVPQGSARAVRQLLQVHCGPVVQTLFVVVPGIGTLAPTTWDDGNGDYWLRTIRPRYAPDIGIIALDNGLGSDETLSWSHIENMGADLLGSLFTLIQQDEKLKEVPIVLIAHSLGGIILKRALCLAQQQPARFRILLHDQIVWQSVTSIIKRYAKTKSKCSMDKDMAKNLADDSLEFEKVFEQKPVLTLFEILETSAKSILGSKGILVGQKLATTKAQLEITLGVRADHNHICCFKAGSLELATITSFIEDAVPKARAVIGQVHDEHKIASALGKSTLGSFSVVSFKDLQKSEDDSKVENPPSQIESKDNTGKRATAGSSKAAEYEALTDFSVPKSEPQLPCHIFPFNKNRGFFGRATILKQIEAVLLPPTTDSGNGDPLESSDLRTFVICGLGGVGKTQIALEFVHQYRNRFNAVFWIHADEVSKLEREFNNVAIALGLVAKDSVESRDYVHTRDLVLGWLAKPLKSYKQLEDEKSEEATWLIVFDNVDDQDTLINFWPKESTGSILITSRDPMIKTSYYSHDTSITLPCFDDKEAADFLLKLTGREDEKQEREGAQDLVSVLGGYPLAISQIAPVIARNDYTFREFYEKYETESDKPEWFEQRIKSPVVRSGYQYSLATVFALENLKKGRSLLDALSVLDPDGIPEYLLEAFEAAAAWKGYPPTKELYEIARTELLQSSLITRDRSAKKLVLHRLIQDVTRSKMTNEFFNEVYGSVVCLNSVVWPYEEDFGFGNDMYRWGRCSELYPHLLKLRKLSSRLKLPTILSTRSIQGTKLFLDGSWHALMISRFDDAYSMLDLAQDIGMSLQKNTPKEQLDSNPELRDELDTLVRRSYHHRGCIALHVNQPDISLTNHLKFTQLLREKLGDNPKGKDQSLGVAWNELGNAYLQNKQWGEGVSCFKKSIRALESLEGSTRITISMPLINLAFAYWLEGQLDQAYSTFAEALLNRENEYGVDDTSSFVTGKLLIGYGNVQAERGLLDDSFSLHQRCLKQYRATVGNNHHRTADACVKVADHFVRIGEYESALTLLNQAHKIFNVRKHFLPEYARVCYRRGRLFEILGKFSEARADLKEATDLYHAIRVGDSTPLAQLTGKDFDENIMFWSR